MARCKCCGRKPPKRVCTEQVGHTDIDNMAVAIYKEWHGGVTYGDYPWDMYRKNKHDPVVQAFRDCAYAVACILEEEGIGVPTRD
jgi:hypothetical protein